MLLSHSVASGDKRESAAASGDAVGRPAARTGWSALHLPSTPDVISFTVRGSGSVWPLDVDSAARIRPAVLTTQTQERSLGRGPLAEPTLRWSPWAAGIFPIPFEIFGALRSLLQYLSSLDRWPAMSGASLDRGLAPGYSRFSCQLSFLAKPAVYLITVEPSFQQFTR